MNWIGFRLIFCVFDTKKTLLTQKKCLFGANSFRRSETGQFGFYKIVFGLLSWRQVRSNLEVRLTSTHILDHNHQFHVIQSYNNSLRQKSSFAVKCLSAFVGGGSVEDKGIIDIVILNSASESKKQSKNYNLFSQASINKVATPLDVRISQKRIQTFERAQYLRQGV